MWLSNIWFKAHMSPVSRFQQAEAYPRTNQFFYYYQSYSNPLAHSPCTMPVATHNLFRPTCTTISSEQRREERTQGSSRRPAWRRAGDKDWPGRWQDVATTHVSTVHNMGGWVAGPSVGIREDAHARSNALTAHELAHPAKSSHILDEGQHIFRDIDYFAKKSNLVQKFIYLSKYQKKISEYCMRPVVIWEILSRNRIGRC